MMGNWYPRKIFSCCQIYMLFLLVHLMFTPNAQLQQRPHRPHKDYTHRTQRLTLNDISDGMIIKGNRNALYLFKDDSKHLIPDFHTFTEMGFNFSSITRIPDDVLDKIPLREPVAKIQAPPPFRPDDYMYHLLCEDPDRMVQNASQLLIRTSDLH